MRQTDLHGQEGPNQRPQLDEERSKGDDVTYQPEALQSSTEFVLNQGARDTVPNSPPYQYMSYDATTKFERYLYMVALLINRLL